MLIGITTTYEEPHNYERTNCEYLRCIEAAGGTPVLLPPAAGGEAANGRAARDMLARLDALVLAGGGDIEPARYGEATPHPDVAYVSPARDALEFALARLAFDAALPVLGICRGMQVMNVARGGALHQDVVGCGAASTGHRQDPPYDALTHRASVAPGTLLERILRGQLDERRTLPVNSMHHQAVSHVGRGLRVSALSDDGLIEAIEHPGHPFYLGVQWHPEYLAPQAALFGALVEAAATSTKARTCQPNLS